MRYSAGVSAKQRQTGMKQTANKCTHEYRYMETYAYKHKGVIWDYSVKTHGQRCSSEVLVLTKACCDVIVIPIFVMKKITFVKFKCI